jgi:PhnB protein
VTKENPPKAGSSIEEVFPYLCVRGAAAAIDFYTQAFGVEETFRLTDPSGRIGHAQLKFGPATVMLSDEYPDHGIQSPLAFGGSGTTIHLHVENVDVMAKNAAEAGATILLEPTDQPHGERQCRLRDPFGHQWLLGHQIENVSHDEMQRRYDAQTQS